MKNKLLFFCVFCFLFLISCNSYQKKTKKTKITSEVPSDFKMYKTSEMAELMRLMLLKNKELRNKIINNKEIGKFNPDYLKIHTATLTDSTDFDQTYPAFASHFIQMQKEVFTVDKIDRKKQFNKSIGACIACHQDRCSGPIPTIEKLKID